MLHISRFSLFFTLLLFPVACLIAAKPCSAAEVAGDACTSVGTTTISADRTNIIACMLKTGSPSPAATCDNAGGCVWKSMTGGSFPIGMIAAWPAMIDPPDMQNWLECKGQLITETDYPILTKIIGTRVPDLRGLFLRGYGAQDIKQKNGTAVGETTTTHSSGSLGYPQGDGLRRLTGQTTNIGAVYGNDSSGAMSSTTAFYYANDYGGARDDPGVSIQFDSALVAPTTNEVRPANMAVRFLIRAR